MLLRCDQFWRHTFHAGAHWKITFKVSYFPLMLLDPFYE